jgi:hypothetical protein
MIPRSGRGGYIYPFVDRTISGIVERVAIDHRAVRYAPEGGDPISRNAT